MVNASMASPTLTSFMPSRLIPHSKPLDTSRTSSLNRRRDPILPVQTEAPSRISRSRGKQYVRFGDLSHRLADDADLHLAGAELSERLGERLDRSIHIALDDELEFARLTLAHLGVELGKRNRLGGAELVLPVQGLALAGDLAGLALVIEHREDVAGRRCAAPAQHLDRRRGPGLPDRAAAFVHHRPHPAGVLSGHERIAYAQRAVLDQHAHHHAA